MKIIKDNKTYTVKEAVEMSLTPKLYEGELDRLSTKIDLQSEMIAGIMQVLADRGLFNTDNGLYALEELLEWGFTVEKE